LNAFDAERAASRLARERLVGQHRQSHPDHRQRLQNFDILGFHHDARADAVALEHVVDDAARARTALEQHPRLSDQVRGRDVAQSREPVVRRHDEQQLFAHHGYLHEIGAVDRKREEPHVDGTAAQPLEQHRRRAGRDLDLDFRVTLPEFLEQGGEDVQADGHPAAQVQRTGELLLLFDDAGGGVADVGEHATAQVEESGAGRREPHLAAQAQEERLSELLLEQEHLAADGRL
jgi:hypothetical protein